MRTDALTTGRYILRGFETNEIIWPATQTQKYFIDRNLVQEAKTHDNKIQSKAMFFLNLSMCVNSRVRELHQVLDDVIMTENFSHWLCLLRLFGDLCLLCTVVGVCMRAKWTVSGKSVNKFNEKQKKMFKDRLRRLTKWNREKMRGKRGGKKVALLMQVTANPPIDWWWKPQTMKRECSVLPVKVTRTNSRILLTDKCWLSHDSMDNKAINILFILSVEIFPLPRQSDVMGSYVSVID